MRDSVSKFQLGGSQGTASKVEPRSPLLADPIPHTYITQRRGEGGLEATAAVEDGNLLAFPSERLKVLGAEVAGCPGRILWPTTQLHRALSL